ncbi:MAG: DedA family protein [Planctomycetes bacterium]|nr:DedA family protein [Planctomycetota bacterium]
MLAGLLLLCGIGLPLPEELILVSAGYVAYRGGLTGEGHHPAGLMATAAGAILVGDSIPYVLGRIFGPKLLRLRLVRSWISQEGLARFDRWFHRHGRLTIFVARFLPGIRVPAFFTAGSMNTSSLRFYLMDGLGVLVSAPLFVWLGYYFGADITLVVEWIQRAERTVLWSIVIGLVLTAAIYFFWYRRRTKRKLLGEPVAEATVGTVRRVTVDVGPSTAVAPDLPVTPKSPVARDTNAPDDDRSEEPADARGDDATDATPREAASEASTEESARSDP